METRYVKTQALKPTMLRNDMNRKIIMESELDEKTGQMVSADEPELWDGFRTLSAFLFNAKNRKAQADSATDKDRRIKTGKSWDVPYSRSQMKRRILKVIDPMEYEGGELPDVVELTGADWQALKSSIEEEDFGLGGVYSQLGPMFDAILDATTTDPRAAVSE